MNMKIKLTDYQMETAGVTCLDRLHTDLKEELVQHSMIPYLEDEDYVAMLRVVVSIEVILKELMHPDHYFQWKREFGVDL
jgi:hypothetical protein|tara:strand:- start:16 stop:255 length:240 start_codon:yes stop_codon:yes gene_type:complete